MIMEHDQFRITVSNYTDEASITTKKRVTFHPPLFDEDDEEIYIDEDGHYNYRKRDLKDCGICTYQFPELGSYDEDDERAYRDERDESTDVDCITDPDLSVGSSEGSTSDLGSQYSDVDSNSNEDILAWGNGWVRSQVDDDAMSVTSMASNFSEHISDAITIIDSALTSIVHTIIPKEYNDFELDEEVDKELCELFNLEKEIDKSKNLPTLVSVEKLTSDVGNNGSVIAKESESTPSPRSTNKKESMGSSLNSDRRSSSPTRRFSFNRKLKEDMPKEAGTTTSIHKDNLTGSSPNDENQSFKKKGTLTRRFSFRRSPSSTVKSCTFDLTKQSSSKGASNQEVIEIDDTNKQQEQELNWWSTFLELDSSDESDFTSSTCTVASDLDSASPVSWIYTIPQMNLSTLFWGIPHVEKVNEEETSVRGFIDNKKSPEVSDSKVAEDDGIAKKRNCGSMIKRPDKKTDSCKADNKTINNSTFMAKNETGDFALFSFEDLWNPLSGEDSIYLDNENSENLKADSKSKSSTRRKSNTSEECSSKATIKKRNKKKRDVKDESMKCNIMKSFAQNNGTPQNQTDSSNISNKKENDSKSEQEIPTSVIIEWLPEWPDDIYFDEGFSAVNKSNKPKGILRTPKWNEGQSVSSSFTNRSRRSSRKKKNQYNKHDEAMMGDGILF